MVHIVLASVAWLLSLLNSKETSEGFRCQNAITVRVVKSVDLAVVAVFILQFKINSISAASGHTQLLHASAHATCIIRLCQMCAMSCAFALSAWGSRFVLIAVLLEKIL